MNQKDHYLKEQNKKVIGLMKDKLEAKILTEFAALRPKSHSYLTDDNDENKKKKKTQKRVSQSDNQNLSIVKIDQKQLMLKIE